MPSRVPRSIARLGVLSALAASPVMLASTPARAQPSQADVLFQEGLREMREGRYADGCPHIAESHRLDPVPGALFTLAECEAAWGKTATALTHYQSFIDTLTTLPPGRRDRFGERRSLALEKMAALATVVPELTVDVAADAPADLVVKRNGVVVARSTYGVETQVDPGDYVVTAERGGRVAWERGVHLGERDRARVEIPALGKSTTIADAPVRAAPLEPSASSPSPWSTPFTVAVVVGGAGLLTGAVAGTVALVDRGTVDTDCPNHLCTPAGRDALHSAQTTALVSTIGFGVGLAGAATAVSLWLLGPRHSESPSPTTGATVDVVGFDRGAGLGVRGAF